VDILVYTKIFSVHRHFVFDFLLVKCQNTKEGQAFRLDIIIKTKNDIWYRNATFRTTPGVEGVNEPAEPPISAKETIAFVTKILYELFPLQRPKIHELIELTAFKILNTRTRINHTGERIYFPLE
jgi:hypothetical protein